MVLELRVFFGFNDRDEAKSDISSIVAAFLTLTSLPFLGQRCEYCRDLRNFKGLGVVPSIGLQFLQRWFANYSAFLRAFRRLAVFNLVRAAASARQGYLLASLA